MTWLLIIVIILIILIFLIKKTKSSYEIYKSNKGKSKGNRYKNNGFASIDTNYTMPVIIENIITPQEAEYILDKTKDSFKDSQIIGGLDTSIRKSQTTWLYKSDPTIYNIIKRICDSYNYPVQNAEPLQVVKYNPGGFYNDHHDSCCDSDNKCTEFVQDGGQRVLTVLIYLNDDFEGGSTEFTEIGKNVKPPRYGGVVFRPLADNTNMCHPLGLHKGTPITSGTKYVCNLWIREGEYKNN